ncbi:hypothetical protein I6G46_15680 [Serratia plymuthica]|uniref:DUF6035 family protein n=1 Tax=Serratia plymuthica TaxID=82996 RepID=UPI0018D902F3|nr:DUF6035 family protein [Serratia plymuthica]QPS85633.1 hypothetical protein I6G46_15680 [Serratia plymuthica]
MALVKRNMKCVFLTEEDRNIDADTFLDNCDDEKFFTYRRKLEENRQINPIALCCVCFQPVVLRGNANRTKFFSHIKNSEDCPIKTTTKFSQEEILAMKYNGQKEGQLHKLNKLKIAELIKLDKYFTDDVRVEPTFREKNNTGIAKRWRRPDISAVFNGENYNVVFELQVTTTFLDVIISRESFYQENNTFIVWVFLNFDPEKFTTLDIAYANRENIFVFDSEAKEKSEKENRIIFKCYYRKPYMTKYLTIDYNWTSNLVGFNDIYLDKESMKVYFTDPAELKKDILKEISRERKRLKSEKEQITTQEKEKKEKNMRENIIRKSEHITNPSLGYRNKIHRNIGGIPSNTENKSFGDVFQCTWCGNLGKRKKIGRFFICDKCGQQIE